MKQKTEITLSKFDVECLIKEKYKDLHVPNTTLDVKLIIIENGKEVLIDNSFEVIVTVQST